MGKRGNNEGTIYRRTDGRWVAAVTLCDMNGWWIDADEDEALEIVREVGRGNVDVPAMAGHLEGWALPKESDL